MENLTRIQSPPAQAVDTSGQESWDSIETRLGTRLPVDYKDYISVYGAGRWADFLGILTPFYQFRHPHAVDYFEWT